MKRIEKTVYITAAAIVISCALSKEPTEIVIRMGEPARLCDQMYLYVLGTSIEKRGFSVKYHVPYIENKNFQLLKAFPYLNFKMISSFEADKYKKFNISHGENYDVCLNCRPPAYILKINCHDRLIDYSKYFYFDKKILDAVNLKILEKIRAQPCAIGVHVRRTDMSISHDYFSALSADYFIKAVQKAKELFRAPYFFFFSDDVDWVKKNILPQLKADTKYEVIDVNDYSKGYMDMFLMSECKHQIRSQGSMGEMSYILNKYPLKKLIAPKKCRTDVNVTPDFEI
ncbi:MAG: alpha-1,2-fucosyltransferase [Holosporaceae bacterium]|jgi:hypothetical protein|nr:alpha-1,2-fucosyltransferase [Holosporaceae bacterium]